MEIKDFKKLLRYEAKTGKFFWKERNVPSFDSQFAGKEAGTVHVSGRGRKSIAIKINGKKMYAHILAWAFKNNEWPSFDIDHIDHDTLNNKYTNLRHVNHTENKKNLPLRSDNKSGFVGVRFCTKSKKWKAFINVDKRTVSLGTYTRKKEAIQARKDANLKYGFHRNHGRNI